MTSASSQPYRCTKSPEYSLGVTLVSAGLAACTSDLFTFPLDTAKVRLQIQNTGLSKHASATVGPQCAPKPRYVGMLPTILTISRQEGPRTLYAGFCAGLQRQMCFSSIRIGFYDSVKGKYKSLLRQDSTADTSVCVRVLSGLTTGALSVTVAQPTDVVKTRMQAQGATGSRVYTGVFQAYRHIGRTEGIPGLWKGYIPNVTRNCLTAVSELVTYDIIKEAILQHNVMSDNFPCHVVSGFGAGFIATVIASPVDVIKTRYMSSFPDQYAGITDCVVKMYKEGGVRTFYKGFTPSFIRFGSWNIITFVCFEQMKRLFSRIPGMSPVGPKPDDVTISKVEIQHNV